MINIGRKQLGASCLSFLISSAAMAQPLSDHKPWAANAFEEVPVESLEFLAEAEMEQTQGQLALLPFIGLVVGADLALASFFWGTYLPTIAATMAMSREPGYCYNCYDYPSY